MRIAVAGLWDDRPTLDPVKDWLRGDAPIAQCHIAEAKAIQPNIHWQEYHPNVTFTATSFGATHEVAGYAYAQ